jgi:hypothetical protein
MTSPQMMMMMMMMMMMLRRRMLQHIQPVDAEALTNIQQKTKAYTPEFIAPPTLLKTSYFDLEKFGVNLSNDPPPFPPTPPEPTETLLIEVSVSFSPILNPTSLTAAPLSFSP